MGGHPLNLALRFGLELAALGSLGLWGWHAGEGALRPVLAVGLPLAGAVGWGVFAVPDDPSRSGGAPVPVPGVVRLGLELALFAAAVWCLLDLGSGRFAVGLGVVVTLHYVASYDRVGWLVRQ